MPRSLAMLLDVASIANPDCALLDSAPGRELHRGKHIGQTLAAARYRRYEEVGLKGAEYHPVNEANLASRTLATSLGGVGRILYHNFDKALT